MSNLDGAVSTVSEVSTLTTDNGLVYFKEYDSQLAIPEVSGTRIIKCLYQISPKTGKKVRENSFIRIPSDHINEEAVVSNIEELAPFIVTFLQDKEDIIIKESHKNGALNVFTPNLSIASILEYLEENETSGRLNKEMITAWFKECIEENLTSLFAAKLGIDEHSDESKLVKLAAVINAYKMKLESLASPKVSFKPEDCAALIGVISKADNKIIADVANSGSVLGKRFIKKLEVMQTKTEDCLLSL